MQKMSANRNVDVQANQQVDRPIAGLNKNYIMYSNRIKSMKSLNNINRQDLEKLSKDELINLVMKKKSKESPSKKVKFGIPNKVKKFISKHKPRDKSQVNIITFDKKKKQQQQQQQNNFSGPISALGTVIG